MELSLDTPVASSEAVARSAESVADAPATPQRDAAAIPLEQARRFGRLSKWALVGADAMAVALVTVLFSASANVMGLALLESAVIPLVLLLTGALVATGAYTYLVVHPVLEMRRTLLAVGIVFGAATAGAFAFGGDDTATISLIVYGGLATFLAPWLRLASRLALGRSGWWGTPVAVLASRDASEAVLDALQRWPEVGLRPVMLFEENASRTGWEQGVLREDLRRAPGCAVDFGIREAIIAMPDRPRHRHADEIRRLTRFFDRVFVVNGELGFGTLCGAASPAAGLTSHVVRDVGSDRFYQTVKRSIDIIGAAILLVALSPLFLLIAALIKIDSVGPVFYRQRRMGRGGRCYYVHKFRTMHVDAEARLEEVLESDPALRAQYQVFHKLAADPRTTGVGRVLRRLSLDELPQLWNVLVGEMSLVGPRAYIPSEIGVMQGLERVILQFRPGITGLWQVSGRNELPFAARVQLDVHYVHSSSGWLDCYILARTVPVVLRREGAN